jgi:hypothetical protein
LSESVDNQELVILIKVNWIVFKFYKQLLSLWVILKKKKGDK